MKWPTLGPLLLLFLTTSLALTACGGGTSAGNGTSAESGAIAFSLVFRGAVDVQPSRAASFDCQGNGIATIEASVYDGDNSLLNTGGPWPCDAGQGTITEVTAGSGHTLVVLARDEGGNLIYQG